MNPFAYNVPTLQADPKVSAEEVRRAQVAESTSTRLSYLISDLQMLYEKDLRQLDPLKALITTGVKILELGLHTKGRLRATEGRSDAFLEATAANVLAGLRQASSVMEEHDLDLGAWAEAQEILKPVTDDLKAISGRLERPGVKTAVTPPVPEKQKPDPGPRLLEEDGEPAPNVTPMPCVQQLQTLGYDPGKVIDVEAVEPHPLDGKSIDEQNRIFIALLEQLEEAGVEGGLKRKLWQTSEKAWLDAWEKTADNHARCVLYDQAEWAAERARPTWLIPMSAEWDAVIAAEESCTAVGLDVAEGV